jgi:membrane-bound lytic murein transglycosylase D
MEANTSEFNEDLHRAQFEKMTSIVEMRYTPEVQTIIRKYLGVRRKISEDVVSKMMLYSPIFDYYFEKYDLPKELLYLAIIESRLEPKARSRVGALGIWQLMAPTAKELGLRIYHSVDERRDVYRSTDAACRYLKQLYKRFGDWTLAIAAYNTGQGRVSRILRESGGKTYWDIRELLPRETAIYVPAFIAATYVFSDYNAHGLIPSRFHPDVHYTTQVTIFNHKVYLREVARLLNIDVDRLYEINPAYKKNYIPSSPRGYNLVVPTRTENHLQYLLDTLAYEHDIRLVKIDSFETTGFYGVDSLYDIYIQTEYIVRKEETLDDIAEMFDLTSAQIRYWNNLRSEEVAQGMILDIPVPILSGKFLMSDLLGTQLMNNVGLLATRQLKLRKGLSHWLKDQSVKRLNQITVAYHNELLDAERERITTQQAIPLNTLSSLLKKHISISGASKTKITSGDLIVVSN